MPEPPRAPFARTRPPATIPLWGVAIPLTQAFGLQEDELPRTLAEVQALVDALYKREVTRALPGVAERIEPVVGAHATRWSIRRMKTRWGSCTPKTGAIRIATGLAAYPPECLDFVVAHELVHLLEPSHNKRFHELLDRAYPRNRAVAAQLKQPAQVVAAHEAATQNARAGR